MAALLGSPKWESLPNRGKHASLIILFNISINLIQITANENITQSFNVLQNKLSFFFLDKSLTGNIMSLSTELII